MNPEDQLKPVNPTQSPQDSSTPSSPTTPSLSTPEPPAPTAGDSFSPTPSSSKPTPAIAPNPVSPPPSIPNTAIPATPNPPKKSHKLRNLIFAVILLLIFGAVIWAATQINKKSQPNSASPAKHDIADLRVGSYEPFPAAFYPNMSIDSYAQEANIPIFEGLTKFVSQTQIAPDLATGWTNPDNNTWVFNLRHGIKFHDGNPMTATQVVASLTQVKNYPVAQQDVPYTIKTVTAVDPYTVKITTSQPDPLLDRELTQFWIWDTGDTKTPNNPINGTGPYTIKPGTKLTSNSLHLVANNSYFAGQPSVKALDFYEYTTAQSIITDLKQNKLDIGDLSGYYGYTQQAKNAGFKLFNFSDPLVYYIVPNTLKKGSPLQNLKVRQAIYMTINPTLLAKAHNNDNGAPATQLVPPSIPGYNPDIKRPAINSTAAKALLAQAGYSKGIALDFMYYSPSQDNVAKELQKELAPIGIKINPDPETDVNVLEGKVADGSVDLYVEGDASTLIDTSDVASAFVIDTPEYSSPKVDALYNQAQQTFNPTARLQLLQQLNAAVMNDLAVFPIFTPTNQFLAYRPGLVLNQQYIGAGITGLYYQQVYSTQ